ncbi:TnsA endonuclease N-terminal domain-containing protein [Paenibacillus silviterrae]|uniref:TnsA endonuclease N-terminal domain-containing protein n=1 Tax=Paenibacillus silviterrae TaxID=3242194 RepID=UPI00254381B6|nr:TnsA endonuclease N-terminal domain-containing protein [Paenibacillus chinjuensis]
MKIPVRKIRPTRGRHYRSKIGSSKSLKIIHAESLLERDYVRLCNYDPSIIKIYYQPVGIRFHYDGRKRRYFPDYLIVTRDNRYYLVEVKLKEFVGSNLNRAKFYAATKLCEEKGWSFNVVTEDQIRPGYLQKNLRLLHEVKRHKITPAVAEYIKVMLEHMGPQTVSELRKACEIVDASMFMLNLHKLIYASEISTDLIHKPLNDNSVVWGLPRKEDACG